MPNPTGPTSEVTRKLISELRKGKLADVARHLARPSRKKRAVNVGRLAKLSKRTDTFVVPGKVTGTGELHRGIRVYALSFSSSAREKIAQSGGKALPLSAYVKEKPKAMVVK